MFNFFKKKEEEEEEKENFIKGLVYGLGGALLVLIVILLVVFGDKIKDKVFDSGDNSNQNEEVSSDAPKLRFTVVTSKDCGDQCFNINLLIDAIKQNDINETGNEVLYIEDRDGKKLVEKYNITKVPTLLVGGELDKNPNLANAWPVLGEVMDNVFIYRELIPPYIDVNTGELKGLVDVVFISDSSCEECYDVNLHDSALENLGVTVKEKKSIDVSSDEGKELVERYNITKVPTMLLKGELDEYAGIQQIWPMVGEVSDDGTYVFTKLDEMGSYKDLETGELVEVELPDLTGAAQPVITQ